jgi:hypothetical protein
MGCDATCTNDCTNSTYISFDEIERCMKFCPCQGQQVIELSQGQVNIPALIAYSEYDVKAWSFYKKTNPL